MIFIIIIIIILVLTHLSQMGYFQVGILSYDEAWENKKKEIIILFFPI